MPADCSDDVSTHDRVKFRVAWRSEEKGVAANTRYTRGVAFEFPKKKENTQLARRRYAAFVCTLALRRPVRVHGIAISLLYRIKK